VRHPFFDLPTPFALGHRGCAGEMPENTHAAFARGLAAGAAVLETDVHLSHDAHPVLIHDADVARVTESVGLVRDLTLRELSQLDAGYHFSPDGGQTHPERARGHRIPTLRAALDRFSEARFNLELKENVPGLVTRVLEVIDAAGAASRTLLVAGDDTLMQAVRLAVQRSGPAVALGASAAEVARFARAAAQGATPERGPMALQIPPTIAGEPLATPTLIRHAHLHDVQVHVFTIDEPEAMLRLLRLGVDGIVTNYPARLTALLAAGV
jgi:glycerophosphoryl diester phosphodiesterase